MLKLRCNIFFFRLKKRTRTILLGDNTTSYTMFFDTTLPEKLSVFHPLFLQGNFTHLVLNYLIILLFLMYLLQCIFCTFLTITNYTG